MRPTRHRFLLGMTALVAGSTVCTASAFAGNWTATVYVQFPDEATARVAAAALGADMPEDGSPPAGNQNYSLVAPIVELEAGAPLPGYWAMMRFNLATAEGAAAYAQLLALSPSPIRTRPAPSNVFQ
jgi:hypothetical protein